MVMFLSLGRNYEAMIEAGLTTEKTKDICLFINSAHLWKCFYKYSLRDGIHYFCSGEEFFHQHCFDSQGLS